MLEPCRAITTTIDDVDTRGHYRVTRYKLVRDSGSAMASALVHKEPAAFTILTKIDGTTVDTRNETPSGLTYSVSGEDTSILVANALLPASDQVFVDIYVGPQINA